MLAKVLTSMGSLFTKAGKAITPKTLVEKGGIELSHDQVSFQILDSGKIEFNSSEFVN